MPDFILPILFFAVFALILAESIIFLKRFNNGSIQNETQETEEITGHHFNPIKVGIPILIVAGLIALGIIAYQRISPPLPHLASTISPTPTPDRNPTLLPTLIPSVQNQPAPTTITPTNKITITVTPTKTIIPTKTPIPTRTPIPSRTPIPTKTPILTPTPKQISLNLSPTTTIEERTGASALISTTPAVKISPTSQSIIQPELPIAGSIIPTVLIIITGILTLSLGFVF